MTSFPLLLPRGLFVFLLANAMALKKTYLTHRRFEELKLELHQLRTEKRHKIADRILHAKDFGGTDDNAEFDDAKNEQAFIEGRIMTLDNMLHNATVIPDEHRKSAFVDMGAKVTVQNESGRTMNYLIVGSDEADPKAGKISNESPVGKALLGSKVGDDVRVIAPARVLKLTIKSIE